MKCGNESPIGLMCAVTAGIEKAVQFSTMSFNDLTRWPSRALFGEFQIELIFEGYQVNTGYIYLYFNLN